MGNELELSPPVTEAQHQAVLLHLKTLVGRGEIELDDFERFTGAALATRTLNELELVVAQLPSPVRLTPRERRATEPVVISASSGSIRLTSAWQLAEKTTLRTKSGSIRADLGAAEFDGREIELELISTSGSIRLVVPRGLDVRVVESTSTSGSIRNHLDPGVVVPGSPVVRIRARARSGSISITHPRVRRRFWLFRIFRR